MNQTKHTAPRRAAPPPPDLSALLEPVRVRLARVWRSARSPYNWLATTLALAAVVLFFIDVKGGVVALGIAYLLAMLRLQLTRRALETRRLALEEERLDLERARFARETEKTR